MPGKSVQNRDAIMEERRRKVAEMYLRGKSQWDIAIALKVVRLTVQADLVVIREQWRLSAIVDFDEAKSRELAKIDNMEAVAWQAWERSCEPEEVEHKKTEKAWRSTPKKGDKKAKPSRPKMMPVKIIDEIKRTGKVGNPQFLERVAWCIELRCKILGFIKPDQHNTNVNVQQNFNWDDLLDPPERTTADDIQQLIDHERQGSSNGVSAHGPGTAEGDNPQGQQGS